MSPLQGIITEDYSKITSNVLIELDVLDELQFINKDSIQIENRFFYPALGGNGLPNIENFIALLTGSIRRFSLSARELEEHKKFTIAGNNIEASNIDQRGKQRFIKYAEGNAKNAGEIGELALFVILEAFLNAPKIASKMKLKTSNAMHVHGADALHATLGEDDILTLILGESKFRKDRSTGLKEAIESVKELIFDDPKIKKEMELIEANIDHEILDDQLKEKILKYFGQFTPESNQTTKTIAILLGYDRKSLYNGLPSITLPKERIAELEKRYLKHVSKATSEFAKILSDENNPRFTQIKFLYMLLPFSDLNALKEQFYKMAGLNK
ncbi:MAG: DUF1837 domain-containing protein [Alphaproteobacteria bacterium]|nr:DUF1837 domain-containing protein [Alphaproteobacteria bacterium]